MSRKRKKEKVVVKNEMSPEELKQYIAECEERYRQSVHNGSCKDIMGAWYMLKSAKDTYYKSVNPEVKPGITYKLEEEIATGIDVYDLD